MRGLFSCDGIHVTVFLGVSGRLVGPAVFKAVEALFTQRLVGSIPIHSRSSSASTVRRLRDIPILNRGPS